MQDPRQTADLATIHCTDFTQTLGDDEIGRQPTELFDIHTDHRLPRLAQPVHLGVDLGARRADVD
jgi:hypothetical protein